MKQILLGTLALLCARISADSWMSNSFVGSYEDTQAWLDKWYTVHSSGGVKNCNVTSPPDGGSGGTPNETESNYTYFSFNVPVQFYNASEDFVDHFEVAIDEANCTCDQVV